MGRPPECNCGCGEVIEPTPCEFTDDFASVQPGYTTYELANSSETPVFTTAAGSISVANGSPVASGTYYRVVELPSSGLKTLSVQATITGSGSQRVGVFIGYTYAYYGRFTGSNLGVRDADAVGETNGDAETTFGSALSSGDAIKMQIQETSTGIFDVTFFKNGTLIQTLTGQPLSVPQIVNVGLYTELGGGWDDFGIQCDDVPAPSGDCELASSVPAVWQLTVSGIQNFTCTTCAQLNGTFFLYYTCRSCFNSSGHIGITHRWNAATSIPCRPVCVARSGWGIIITEHLVVPFDPSWEGGVHAFVTYGRQGRLTGALLCNFNNTLGDCTSPPLCRDSPTFAQPPSVSSSFPPSHTWNWNASNILTAVASGATTFPVCCTNLPSTLTITPA